MKTLGFSYRKALSTTLLFTVLGAIGIAFSTPTNTTISVLLFIAIGPAAIILGLRLISPYRICYSKDEIIIQNFISGECRFRWENFERIDYRKGNQHVFRFGIHSLSLFPYCYENDAWSDFTQLTKIKNATEPNK